MRLLQSDSDGNLSLTELEDNIPEYAILSHRWGAEEVTFKDLIEGTGEGKAGYGKIQFCGEQARRDGLQYFWVDTCCIDKTNAVEYQYAINSMFRWYRDATKCYVYLLDVSRPLTDPANESNEDWVLIFRKSAWFRRGWTLQELLAPASVDFFSREGELLGNKASLEQDICEITGIPATALRGSVLSDFSVAERISWAECRETTYKEDKAYSLLGIFDVYMPLIYGEGKDRALLRLREEIDKASRGTSLSLGNETAVGLEHTSTLHTVNYLGNLFVLQGKLVEAEQIYERWALKDLGPEHTTARRMANNLGLLYVDHGRLAQAEELDERVLKKNGKAIGLGFLAALPNNIDSLFSKQRKRLTFRFMMDQMNASSKQQYQMTIQSQQNRKENAIVTARALSEAGRNRALVDQTKAIEGVPA